METNSELFTYQFLRDWLIIYCLGMLFGIVGVFWKSDRYVAKKRKRQSQQLIYFKNMLLGGTAALLMYTFSQLLVNSSPYLGIISAIVGGLFYPKILPELEKAIMQYFIDMLPRRASRSKKLESRIKGRLT